MGGIISEWTLLSNHGLTLLSLADNPEATTREIADDLGLTEMTVQRIVSDLHSVLQEPPTLLSSIPGGKRRLNPRRIAPPHGV